MLAGIPAGVAVLLLCVGCDASGSHADNSNRKSLKSVGEQQNSTQQLALFCNITSACRACPPAGQPGKATTSELHQCRHFSHVEDLDCMYDLAGASHVADVKIDAPQGTLIRLRHSKAKHHQGCLPDGNLQRAQSVAWFEFCVVAVLLIALPVVVWRKYVVHTGRR